MIYDEAADCWQFEQPAGRTTGEVCLRHSDARPLRLTFSKGGPKLDEVYAATSIVEGIEPAKVVVALTGLTAAGPQTFEGYVDLEVLALP